MITNFQIIIIWFFINSDSYDLTLKQRSVKMWEWNLIKRVKWNDHKVFNLNKNGKWFANYNQIILDQRQAQKDPGQGQGHTLKLCQFLE